MLRDANDSGNDGSLLTGYTMDDIDLNSLRSYRIEFEHRNPEHIWNGNDDEAFLKNMGGHSVARNPRIQTMFRMIGLGDNIGSGFPAILNAWGKEQWRKPDLSQNEELHQVELKLWMPGCSQ